MFILSRKTAIFVTILTSAVVVGGCTNWEKEYRDLEVKYKNLEGRHELAQLDR